jgi:hypothetical protein
MAAWGKQRDGVRGQALDEALEELAMAISACAERARRVADEGSADAAQQYANAADALARAYQQLASSRPEELGDEVARLR